MRRARQAATPAVLLVLLLAGGLPAAAAIAAEPGRAPEGAGLHPDLAGESPEATVRVLHDAVTGRTRPEPSPEQRISLFVELVAGADRERLFQVARDVGGREKYQYRILPNVVNLRGVPRKHIATLSEVPGVVRVVEDREATIHMNDSTPHVRALQADLQAAGIGATGAGARVCIVDTGIDPDHTMYAARIDTAAGYDFFNDDSDPTDDNGHGSHVAGTALGRTGFDVDFGGGTGPEPLQGVAPSATLIGVKVLGATGSGEFSDVIAGIDHCADPALPGGPADVINMSLGGGLFTSACDDDPAAQATNNAVDAGVVVVVSSGNNGSANGLGTPACASKALAIGATYDDDFPNPDFPDKDSFSFIPVCSDFMPDADDLTCFSNRTPQLDVAAPGCLTFSADGLDPSTTAIDDKCGTSMSAPHVAGLAALILDQDPSLTPQEVRTIIRQGAVDLGAPGYDTSYGYGRIDAIASLRLASACSIDSQCDDGLFCNGVESCFGARCRPGQPACPGQGCDEAADACVACAQDADCDNGIVCDGSEVCTAGVCGAGPVSCNVFCDQANNQCVECFGDGDCNDGDSCNGVETCRADGTCQVTITDCNDNLVDDLCDIADSTSSDTNPENGVPDECDALVRFTLTEIPTLGGPRAQAHGLNSFGHVVGFSETGQFDTNGEPIFHGFLWDGASIVDLGTLGGENSVAYDINDSGRISGTADLVEALPPPPLLKLWKNQPTQWDNLSPTQLEALPGGGWWTGTAWAVNNAGHVGGNVVNGYEMIRGAIWNQQQRPVEVPPMQNADMTDVWGLADNGDAVGWWNETFLGFNRKAFLMKQGGSGPVELGTLGGTWAWAIGINNKGHIVGQSSDAAGILKPFLKQGLQGPMTDLGNLGGTFSLARSINFGGQIVGTSTFPGSESLDDRRAFFWENGILEDLTDLVPGHFGWTVRDAWDINDAGQIAAHGLNRLGLERAARLDPCGGGPPCFPSNCTTAADCDDGLFCNGIETCPAGLCTRGLPPSCADGDLCTQDSCNPDLNACVNATPSVPSEPAGVTMAPVSPGSTFAEMVWGPTPFASSYNVYRGAQPDLSDQSCFLSGVTTLQVQDDGSIPPAGGALYHQLTAVNCSGESPFGPGRPAPPSCP